MDLHTGDREVQEEEAGISGGSVSDDLPTPFCDGLSTSLIWTASNEGVNIQYTQVAEFHNKCAR